MFKVKNNTAPEIMKELFAPKMGPYNLCHNKSFKISRVDSIWNDNGLVFLSRSEEFSNKRRQATAFQLLSLTWRILKVTSQSQNCLIVTPF